MRFSIITVTYNCADIIEETMLSVLNQTHPDIEYIIIDGGSADSTTEIIKKYADRLAFWLSESDKGIYDAMNKGIAHATGDYINFMNVGDRFVNSNVLSEVAKKIVSTAKADIVYGNTYKYNAKRHWEDLSHQPEVLRFHGAFCHQSGFVSTEYHKIHLFDLHYRYMADFNLFHQAYMNGASFLKLDLFVAEYNAETGASLSQIKTNYKELEEILVDTDTSMSRLKRRIRYLLGQLKRMIR